MFVLPSCSHSVEQLKQVPSECVLGFGPVPYEAEMQIPFPQQCHLRVPFAPEREQLSQNAPQGNALPQTLHGGEGRTGMSFLACLFFLVSFQDVKICNCFPDKMC